MSSIYTTEPITSGRVVIETTHGPIDIQLWCKECPCTTKYFLQLCQDGFYDQMIFHRIVPNLLIQTGYIRGVTKEHGTTIKDTNSSKNDSKHSVTGTVTTDSLYHSSDMKEYLKAIKADVALERGMKYECNNSRIKFNHRGQVAMAIVCSENDSSSIDDNNNNSEQIQQPQFFITTDDAEYLNGKFIIFGTVTSNSPTMFNVLRINQQTDIDESSYEPTDLFNAPRIISVRILDNTIHSSSIITFLPSNIPWNNSTTSNKEYKEPKTKKRKGKFDTNVLSFGDELVVTQDGYGSTTTQSTTQHVAAATTTRNYVNGNKQSLAILTDELDDPKQQQPGYSNRNDSILQKAGDDAERNMPAPSQVLPKRDKQQSENDRAIETLNGDDELVIKEHTITRNYNQQTLESTTTSSTYKAQPTTTSTGVSAIERRRANYLANRKKSKQERQNETIAKLNLFKGKISSSSSSNEKETINDVGDIDQSLAARMARRVQKQQEEERNRSKRSDDDDHDDHYYGQILEHDDVVEEDDRNGNWLRTTFKCKKQSSFGNNYSGSDGRNAMDDYEVIDDTGFAAQRRGHNDKRRDHSKRHDSHNQRHQKQSSRHDYHHHHTDSGKRDIDRNKQYSNYPSRT